MFIVGERFCVCTQTVGVGSGEITIKVFLKAAAFEAGDEQCTMVAHKSNSVILG